MNQSNFLNANQNKDPLSELIGEQKKINRRSKEDRGVTDPNGREYLLKLRDLCGSTGSAAEKLGISPSHFSHLTAGTRPVGRLESMAAQKVIDDMNQGIKKADQFVAVVTVPAEQGERLAMAVRAVGGTFSRLTFKGNGGEV